MASSKITDHSVLFPPQSEKEEATASNVTSWRLGVCLCWSVCWKICWSRRVGGSRRVHSIRQHVSICGYVWACFFPWWKFYHWFYQKGTMMRGFLICVGNRRSLEYNTKLLQLRQLSNMKLFFFSVLYIWKICNHTVLGAQRKNSNVSERQFRTLMKHAPLRFHINTH